MPGLFPPDAIVRRVDSEPVLLLGGGRALLMQLAHPSVAAGVADHSDFRRDPMSRLQRTLDATEPALLLARQLTVGLLPAPLRLRYGFGWDRQRQAALDLACLAARQVLSRVPAPLRRLPARVSA